MDVDDAQGEVATVFVRYEQPDTREVIEISQTISTAELMDSIEQASATFRLQAGVAEFAELLRDSTWAEGGSYSDVLRLVSPVSGELPDRSQVDELIRMIEAAVRFGDR